MSTFSDALDKAKIGLIMHKNSVFLSTIVFSLKQEENNTIPTAATNGIKLFINTDWFMALTAQARIGLLAHEAWHVALEHITRSGNRNFHIWNKAADYVINIMLVDAGYELPIDGLLDAQFRGMSTEQVYDKIYRKEDEQDSYDCDIQAPENAKDLEDVQQQITDILIKAATQSKLAGDAPGTIPGDVEMVIEKLVNPILPWNLILQDYFATFTNNDYSYRRPKQSYLPDFYVPRLYSESMDHLVIAADISYSMLKAFPILISEMIGIRESVNPVITTIIPFDTELKDITILNQDDKIEEVLFAGGGGTSLKPVFEHLKNAAPTVLLVFSDLFCDKIQHDPGYPVIWCCIDNQHATTNFGKLIHIDTSKLEKKHD